MGFLDGSARIVPTAPAGRRLCLVLAAGLLGGCSPAGEAQRVRPDVIFLLVDTLRADHLGCYGYERPTSPNLDRMAAAGVLFEQTHAHCNWTVPSVTTLLSGCYPPLPVRAFSEKVPEGMLMAAEWFRENGYRTGGITMTIATRSGTGFDQGYERYEEPNLGRREPGTNDLGVDWLVPRALELVDAWSAAGVERDPYFLYLHTMEPHEPYRPHRGYPSFGEPYSGPAVGTRPLLRAEREGKIEFDADARRHIGDLYDGEILFHDAWVGRLLAGLEERGLAERTLIVVVADHGEELFERGDLGHSHLNLHVELTHIPLLFYWPGALPAGRRVSGLMRSIDVLPTLVEVAGLPPLPAADGCSAVPAVTGERSLDDLRPDGGRLLIERATTTENIFAIRTREHLFVYDPEPTRPKRGRYQGTRGATNLNALYDLQADPEERHDIWSARPALVERLTRMVERWREYRSARVQSYGPRPEIELDEETRRRLEDLGYLR